VPLPPHAAEKRRSTRVLRAIPVTVSGIDLLGQPFKELTTTIAVNRHGCTYRSKHYVPQNTTVTLEIAQPDPASPAPRIQGRVAWVQRPRTAPLLYEIGVEFKKPASVRGMALPPDDESFEVVEEVEEIIVDESSNDTAKDYASVASQRRKTGAAAKARRKKRRKKKTKRTWDVFICHASEDKDSFVRPLAEALKEKGLRVWYDEFTLRVGDGLRRSIDKGLAASKFGAVVVSPSFFKKQWPQRELDGLVAKEIDDRRIILPVWHNVSLTEVREHSITLADRIAANSADGIQTGVEKLLLAIRENG